MDAANQLLKLLQQGLTAVFQVIGSVWAWSIRQIREIPWEHLSELPPLKLVLLVAVAGAVIYMLYRAGKELLEAGEKLLTAAVALVTVLVRTLPFIVIAGVVAAGGAWLIRTI